MPKGAEKEIDDVMLTEQGIIPENLPAAEDAKKVERFRLVSAESNLFDYCRA